MNQSPANSVKSQRTQPNPTEINQISEKKRQTEKNLIISKQTLSNPKKYQPNKRKYKK